MRKTFNVLKKLADCRRTRISSIAEYKSPDIPSIGDVIFYNGRKIKVIRVFNHPKSGPLVEWKSEKDGELNSNYMGACLAHYWWDKIKEMEDKAAQHYSGGKDE